MASQRVVVLSGRLANFLQRAESKLRDKGPDGIGKKAVAARGQAGRLQSLAEARKRQAETEAFRKRHGLQEWGE